MMADRELLELAAKSVGVDGTWDDVEQAIRFKRRPLNMDHWNPLVNHGDVLRLQVSLMLDVRHSSDEVAVRALFDEWMTEPVCGDRLQATCRATTRAAAAIGKVMP